MEQDEALELAFELQSFLKQDSKLGLSTFLETPREWDVQRETGWKVLVDVTFIKNGEYDNLIDFIELKNKKWDLTTRNEHNALIIYTPK
jgi:hypothetical protein